MRLLFALHDYDEELKRRGAFCIPVDEALDLNEQGYGIFTTVNSFKSNRRIEAAVNKLCYWFVDMDGGSKTKQYERIVDFNLIPSLVVETKRGHHVYWKIKTQPTKEEYDSALERLIVQFDADRGAKSCTRILRTPGFLHKKNPSNPFRVKQLFASEAEYNFYDFDNALPEIEAEIPRAEKKFSFSGDNFWDNVVNLPADYALLKLSGSPCVNGEEFEIMPERSGKKQIKVNGRQANCFIDSNGDIGSARGAGPSVIQWLEFYGHSKADVADIIKLYFPETVPETFNLKGI